MIKPSSCLIIGVAGGVLSGKTSICNILAERFSKTEVSIPIITTDWFYNGPSVPNEDINWNDPESIDVASIVRVLSEFKNRPGEIITAPGYNHKQHRRIENINLIMGPVIIIEGPLILSEPQIRALLDLKIFINCDADTTFARYILKNINHSFHLMCYKYNTFIKPARGKYIEPSKKYADIIIPNDGTNDLVNLRSLDILELYIKSKLI